MDARIGILLFDDVEELDFAGPWEVFTAAAMMGGVEPGRVVTIAEQPGPGRCAKRLRVLPNHTFDVIVLDGPRFGRDGQLVTAAGVSAGIDLALWLVGQLESPEFARRVQRTIQYEPEPPYAD